MDTTFSADASFAAAPAIGVLSYRNLQSPWSSTHHYASMALRRRGLKVSQIAHDFVRRHLDRGTLAAVSRIFGKRQKPLDLKEMERAVLHDLDRRKQDVILAFHSSMLVEAMERATQPLIYITDATPDLLEGYYPARTDLAAGDANWIHECETRMVARADAIVAPTEWVANSIVQRYGASAEKVSVVEWGANLLSTPAPVERAAPTADGSIELLFIGLDFLRKGGDIAVETVDHLIAEGVDARLTMVGAEVPREFHRPYVHDVGRLNRAAPAEAARLDNLFLHADFCLHPARAECFGHSLCEALAFGVPVIASDTGGISQCVMNGGTGKLLPPDARSLQFAGEILTLLSDPEAWTSMRRRAMDDYRARLNWNRWAERVVRIAEQLAWTESAAGEHRL